MFVLPSMGLTRIYDLTTYDVRFFRHFVKAGAKVLLFFDIRKFLSNNFAKKVKIIESQSDFSKREV